MNILDIFYNEIIKEASEGSIKSYFTYNILFDTYIEEDNKKVNSNVSYNGVITPLLIINNKALFDKLLIEYVEKAKEFYISSSHLNDVKETLDEEIKIEKNIMAMLWSNATFEDFQNPIGFIKRRINFLDSNLNECKEEYGYVQFLNGNLSIEIKKDEIYNETPYQMIITLTNDDNETYEFPLIKFGLDNNTLYIYAIQNRDSINNSYSKKINRILYKVNSGFQEKEDIPEIYGIDNLKDISASFLVSLNIAISYFNNLGIEKVVVPSILLPRWNAKRIAIEKRYKNKENYTELLENQERIQKNLTEKFLRTFLRLKIHYDGLEVISYPFEYDSNLHLDISNMHDCNNELLGNTFDIVKGSKNERI